MSDCTRCGTIYKCPDCTPIRAEYARVARGALLTGMEDDAALLDAVSARTQQIRATKAIDQATRERARLGQLGRRSAA